MIQPQQVKSLREQTGAGYMACKNALVAAQGDIPQAVQQLREKGIAIAQKKSARNADESIIGSYLHNNGQIAVLVEMRCETDFAATTSVFQDLVKNIAMHIAAMQPIYVERRHVPTDILASEQAIYQKQLADSDKPVHVTDTIVQGKVEKFYQQQCLLEQAYYKDSSQTVHDVVRQHIARIGENIEIARFVRWEAGQS